MVGPGSGRAGATTATLTPHGEVLAVNDAVCKRTEAPMKSRTRRAAWWPPPHRHGGKASAHRLLCSSRADGSRSPSTTARPISGTAAAAVASVNHHHHHRHRSAAVQPGELQSLPDPFERVCSCASLTQPIDSCHGSTDHRECTISSRITSTAAGAMPAVPVAFAVRRSATRCALLHVLCAALRPSSAALSHPI